MANINSFKKEMGLIIVGAVIFTASFLWKDFLSDFEEIYFPKKYGLGMRFVFVLVVTIMLVLIAVHLRKFFGLNTTTVNIDPSLQFDDQPIGNNGSAGD